MLYTVMFFVFLIFTTAYEAISGKFYTVPSLLLILLNGFVTACHLCALFTTGFKITEFHRLEVWRMRFIKTFYANSSEDLIRIKFLELQVFSCRRENQELKKHLDEVRTAQSLAKADFDMANQRRFDLVQKHLHARFVIKALISRNESLLSKLSSTHSASMHRIKVLKRILVMLLLFWRFSRLSVEQNKALTKCNVKSQARFSVLLSSHLNLRKKFLSLHDLQQETKSTSESTAQRLKEETSALGILKEENITLEKRIQRAINDAQFYEALAWSIVTRYDNLQTEHGQLLVDSDLLKAMWIDFRECLRKIAAQVQEVKEMAEVSLNNLHKAVKPTKTKIELLRIGQGIALAQLLIAELTNDMSRTIGIGSRGQLSDINQICTTISTDRPYTCTPGSVEDAVRKLKVLYQANGNDGDDDDENGIELRGNTSATSSEDLQGDTFTTVCNYGQCADNMRHLVEKIQSIITHVEGDDPRGDSLLKLILQTDIN